MSASYVPSPGITILTFPCPIKLPTSTFANSDIVIENNTSEATRIKPAEEIDSNENRFLPWRSKTILIIKNRQLTIVNNGRKLITFTNISGRYSISPPITFCETVKVTRFTGCKYILVVVSILETEPCSIHHGLIIDMIARVIANIFRNDLISFFLRVRYVPINKKIAKEQQ